VSPAAEGYFKAREAEEKMPKIARVSLGLFTLTVIALAAMPAGKAAAQAARAPASTCSLDDCVEAAQQDFACCKNPDADGCGPTAAAMLAASKTCGETLVRDVADCPAEVLTCEIGLLGKTKVLLGGGVKK
jgi:hypothetical protein